MIIVTISLCMGLQYAAEGFNGNLSLAVFLRYIGRHGARAIAASGHFTAILIENLHKHIGAIILRAWRMHDEELVTAMGDTVIAGRQRTNLRPAQRKRLAASVNNDEIIAQPVHFAESDGGGIAHEVYIGLINR
jgi:hypothetical protein